MTRHEKENKHLQGQRVGLYSVGVWPRLIKKRSGYVDGCEDFLSGKKKYIILIYIYINK